MERGSGEPDEVLALRRILAVLAAEGAEGPDSESQAGAGEEPEEHRPLLYASLASLRDGFSGYCASAPQDWEGERSRSWPGRLGEVSAPFRDRLLRAERASGGLGRRLLSGAAVAKGGAICERQPPLAMHQYQDSRRVCEVCSHCHRFVGSLGSALRRAAAASGADAEALVEGGAPALQELDEGEWLLRGRAPCERGCGAVFCGPECAAAASREGWHRALCVDVPPEKRPLWALFRRHAARHHEVFILAAQVMAEIVCLVRHSGVDLFEAMAFFTRFAKMSWLNMVSVPSRSTCEPLPRRGPLAGIAQAKQGKRFKAMSESLEILSALLWEKRFAELLNIDFYSNLVGQFSLSNVWVRIEHPLASRLAECSKDESFKQRYGRLLEVATRAAKEAADDDDDEPPVDQKVDAGCGGWRLGRFEGSALFACMALSNHSCLPNFDMRFTDGAIATMVALSDVEEGGELHLAYVSPSKPLDERLATLWRTWGFVCTCRKCQDQLMARAVGEGGDTAGSAVPGGPAGLKLSAAGIAAASALARSRPPTPAGAPPRGAAALDLLARGGFGAVARPPRHGAGQGLAEGSDESDAPDAEASEDEEEETGSEAATSSATSDEPEGAPGAFGPSTALGGPLGRAEPPASVRELRAELQGLMDLMADEGEDA